MKCIMRFIIIAWENFVTRSPENTRGNTIKAPTTKYNIIEHKRKYHVLPHSFNMTLYNLINEKQLEFHFISYTHTRK